MNLNIHKHFVGAILAALIVPVQAGAERSEAQIGEPERLRISDNGRFLVRKDGSPVFLLGDTAWALPWKLNRNELVDYLDQRRKQGFNLIGVVAVSPYDTAANAHGDRPFHLRNDHWDPSQPIATEGDDPGDADAYDYWDHLQFFIEQAGRRGMYVSLAPTFGELVAGSWNGRDTSRVIFDTTNAYAFGHWLGSRCRSHQHILWMIGGDRDAIYGDRDYRPVYRAMAEGIADGTNGDSQQDKKADYGTTLMSYWPRKKYPNSSEWFHNDPWLDFNSIQDSPQDQVRSITHDYGLQPSRPTWLYEGRYENNSPQFKDYQVRFQAWQTVFAGGFGHLYGNRRTFDFGRGWDREVAAGNRDNWRRELSSAGADSMTHLASLMASLSADQALQRIPDQDLLDGDPGTVERTRSSRIQAARGVHGDYALIYTAAGRDVRVKMERLAAPSMDAFWFNPRNGKWHVEGSETTLRIAFATGLTSGSGTPVREFDAPGKIGDGNDWVLVLSATQQVNPKAPEKKIVDSDERHR